MTTRDLGELGDVEGEQQERETLTFKYFGKPMRSNPLLTDLVLLDFMDRATTIEVPEDMSEATMEEMRAANDMITGFLKRAVHPDDFAELWQTALDKGQDTSKLMALAMSLVGEVASESGERPTVKPSGSQRGRQSTLKKSGGGASSRVAKRLASSGRPDLALSVIHAQEARERLEAPSAVSA